MAFLLGRGVGGRRWLAVVLVWLGVGASAWADAWDAPPSYYAGATGTGATLKSQLASAMTAGHIERSYGDFRYSAAITDADPDSPGRILLAYTRASVSGNWDAGNTWNREHVWPQSRQPGSVSNSTKGNLGDPHALRPVNPSINSIRGNDPFAAADTTGSARSIGSYWFPGDAEKGDIARQLFYSDTRWSSLGLSLTTGYPSGNAMGDLGSLLAWHYLDVPDTFERRRNHTIYSQAHNPSYYTRNRNAFIDRPELVWSVYVDQQNDSRLTLQNAVTGSDGGSTLDVDLGRVIVGAAVNTTASVTLNKAGLDGAYYAISTAGSATSSVTGRHHAFAMNTTGSRQIDVGLSASTAVAGVTTGSVTIDNLDVTTQGGAGRGGNDADDTVNLSLTVLNHAEASFASGADMDVLEIDFGSVLQSRTIGPAAFAVHNLGGALTAGLDLDAIQAIGDVQRFTTTLSPFTALAGGAFSPFAAAMSSGSVGTFEAHYLLTLSDEDLPGAAANDPLALTLRGAVEAVMLGDMNGDRVVDAADLPMFVLAVVEPDSYAATVDLDARLPGDLDHDGDVDRADARLAADALPITGGTTINRKANYEALDLAYEALLGGADDNFFGTTLATPKDYAVGDSRGDLAGLPGGGADGVIDAADIDFLMAVINGLVATGDAQHAATLLGDLAIDADADGVFTAQDALIMLGRAQPMDAGDPFAADAWLASLTRVNPVPEPAGLFALIVLIGATRRDLGFRLRRR